jgi:hypothetical protein
VREAGCTITLREEFRTVLHPLTYYKDEDWLRSGFMLSRSLSHEAVHATWSNAAAVFRKDDMYTEESDDDDDDDGSSQSSDSTESSYGEMTEPFFEGQRECELGKAWGTFAYGGHFDIHTDTDTDTDKEAFQTLQYGLFSACAIFFAIKKIAPLLG